MNCRFASKGESFPSIRVSRIHLGQLTARRYLAGRPIAAMDALLAATAAVRGLALVTRKVTDFEDLGIQLVNPWNPG